MARTGALPLVAAAALVGSSAVTPPAATAAKAPLKVSLKGAKRDALARSAKLPVRISTRRAGRVKLVVRSGRTRAARTKSVPFRRAARRTVLIELSSLTAKKLRGCGALELEVRATMGRNKARSRISFPACAPVKRRADGKADDWVGTPTYLGGHTTVSRGELVHTDYLHDDHGPDLDGTIGTPAYRAALAPVRGDHTYPITEEARLGNNAADLRELRLAADADDLHVFIALQTMKVPDAAMITLAVDTDGNDASTTPWPEGTLLTTPGPDAYLTTWGTGARFTDASGTKSLDAAVNLEENFIEVDVPMDALGPVAPGARVWIVVGLHAGAGAWLERSSDSTPVFNVGFRGKEEFPRFDGAWSENAQAKALAALDIAPFAHPLPLARLKAGESDPPFVPKPGYYNRVFRSRLDYGEGVVLDANGGEGNSSDIGGGSAPTFLSRWQPYGLYIPQGFDPARPNPLLLDGHSLDHVHNQYIVASPNQYRQLGDERKSIVITPLARGSDTWYLDAGLVDTLEAWEDVRRAYPIDEDRTFITGYSMGGYMTYRLGTLMPDRFARASVYVGPPAYRLWPYPLPPQSDPEWLVPGNTNRLPENLFNVPTEIVHGNADELVPMSGVQHQADTLMAAGNAVRFYRHSGDDHFSFILYDEWARTRDWLGTGTRERNPVRVRYRRLPAADLPKHNLIFDGAYWVDGIEVRDKQSPEATGFVDATTHGMGGQRLTPKRLPDQAVAGPVTPATMAEQILEPAGAIPEANAFEVTLRNVSSAAFDLDRMSLKAGAPLEVKVDTDGAATLVLRGRFPAGVKVTRGGATVQAQRAAGELRIPITPGTEPIRVTSTR